MSAAKPIDDDALANLLELTGGDPAFLAELIDAYVDDTPEQLAAMHQAVAVGDMSELRRAAHSLKSNSANFGAFRLAELCAGVEAQAQAGASDRTIELVAQVEAEYDRVRRALQDVRAAE